MTTYTEKINVSVETAFAELYHELQEYTRLAHPQTESDRRDAKLAKALSALRMIADPKNYRKPTRIWICDSDLEMTPCNFAIRVLEEIEK